MTISRRDLLKTGVIASIAATVNVPNVIEAAPAAKSMIGVPFERRDKVRIGIVGVGERGRSMIHDLNGIENLGPRLKRVGF